MALTQRNPHLTTLNIEWTSALELPIGLAEELTGRLEDIHKAEIKALTPRKPR